ncbi:hypothetical protein [Pectobacterium sp. B1J-3]|uniref:hypothetical protein n=1 Tax=Pectobacterium sp. B1J-3 TaxID=3385371 RepID=UPI003905950F
MNKIFFILCLFSPFSFALCEDVNLIAEQKQILFPHSDSGYLVTEKERTYLYSAPDEKCKLKDIFLIRGDRIDVYSEYNGFLSMMYLKKNGESITGWIRSHSVKPTGIGVGPINPDGK